VGQQAAARLGELIYIGEVAEAAAHRRGRRRCTSAPAPRWKPPGPRWPPLAPELTELWLRFASPPVRHAGTMGGNVANGSPIGDSAPVLMALDATLVLRQRRRDARMPLTDFYLDYMKNRCEPGEFVRSLEVPLPPPARCCAPTRSASASTATSRRCAGLRAATRGVASCARRAGLRRHGRHVKRAAHGRGRAARPALDEATLRRASAALAQDFTAAERPARQRRLPACRWRSNLLRRFWLETRPTAAAGRCQRSASGRGHA
jgi:xanthine dehydrogenase small subunit